jgi:hypothetical protein
MDLISRRKLLKTAGAAALAAPASGLLGRAGFAQSGGTLTIAYNVNLPPCLRRSRGGQPKQNDVAARRHRRWPGAEGIGTFGTSRYIVLASEEG